MSFTRCMTPQKTFPYILKDFNSFHTNGAGLASAVGKGQVYEKNPTKFLLKKGKTYNWCACGLSNKVGL